MIGYLSGQIKAIHRNFIILATGSGVGYKVFVIPQVLVEGKIGEDTELYTLTYVREDHLTLYGFRTLVELDLFEMLLSVSGIGPKVALAIMSLGDMRAIRLGILNSDVATFTSIPGIGKKTAERLIMELKDKIADQDFEAKAGGVLASSTHADVMEVLTALGYSTSEAKAAINALPKDLETSEEKIREALRSLAKK